MCSLSILSVFNCSDVNSFFFAIYYVGEPHSLLLMIGYSHLGFVA